VPQKGVDEGEVHVGENEVGVVEEKCSQGRAGTWMAAAAWA